MVLYAILFVSRVCRTCTFTSVLMQRYAQLCAEGEDIYLQLLMGFRLIRGSSRLLVLEQIVSSQRCLRSRAVGEGILIDGEVGGVVGCLRSASLVVHAYKVVVGGRDHLGIEGEVLGTHQRLPVPHVLGANHLTGHIHEETVELRAVDGWGEERDTIGEEVHSSIASLHGCLRHNHLGQKKRERESS